MTGNRREDVPEAMGSSDSSQKELNRDDDNGHEDEDSESWNNKHAEGDGAKNVVAQVPQEELYTREWPCVHKPNNRVRKLIAAYVRMKKREQKKLIAEQDTERVRKLKEEQRLARLAEQRESRGRKQ